MNTANVEACGLQSLTRDWAIRLPLRFRLAVTLAGLPLKLVHLMVSWNRGTTISSILMGFSILNQPIWIPQFMETHGNPIWFWPPTTQGCRCTTHFRHPCTLEASTLRTASCSSAQSNQRILHMTPLPFKSAPNPANQLSYCIRNRKCNELLR